MYTDDGHSTEAIVRRAIVITRVANEHLSRRTFVLILYRDCTQWCAVGYCVQSEEQFLHSTKAGLFAFMLRFSFFGVFVFSLFIFSFTVSNSAIDCLETLIRHRNGLCVEWAIKLCSATDSISVFM